MKTIGGLLAIVNVRIYKNIIAELSINGTNSDPGPTKLSTPNQKLRRSKRYPWCRREDREKSQFALLEWAYCMLIEYNFVTTKIEEILQTGDLQRIRYEKTKDVEVTRLFQGIYGVGTHHVSLQGPEYPSE